MVARLAAKAATKFLKKRATPKAKPKAADKARQEAGRKAADLGTPASEARKSGRTYGTEIPEPSPTDVGIARGTRLSTMKGVQKDYNDKFKELEELTNTADFFQDLASPGKNKTVKGRHEANQRLKDVRAEIKRLKAAMEGMLKRHNIKKKDLYEFDEEGFWTISKAKGGPIHTTFPKRAAPRTEGRETAIDLFPKVERAKGSKVGKKEQGYKARKDESIAQRVKKERTPKQLKASRHESYGKPGSGKGKGKINRISSKQTDGNKLVASLYD